MRWVNIGACSKISFTERRPFCSGINVFAPKQLPERDQNDIGIFADGYSTIYFNIYEIRLVAFKACSDIYNMM